MHACVYVGRGSLGVHDIPSKRQTQVLVERVSVPPLARWIFPLLGALFTIQLIHGKVGASVVPVWVIRVVTSILRKGGDVVPYKCQVSFRGFVWWSMTSPLVIVGRSSFIHLGCNLRMQLYTHVLTPFHFSHNKLSS